MNDDSPSKRSRKHQGDSLRVTQWIVFGLFLLALVTTGAAAVARTPIKEGWPEAMLVLLAFAVTLISLARQLPAQTVGLATILIAAIGGTIHCFGAVLEMPFGRFVDTSDAGPQLFHALSWAVPFIWVIVILNSRGVGRLILRPWRKTRVYGFWLIGLTAALTLLFDLGMEPFASRVKHYWLWSPSKLAFDWYGAPVSNFVGWTATALLIMAFVTPVFTKKKPAKAPPDYTPLLVWVLLNGLFIVGAASQQLWLAVTFSAAACVVASIFAIRGARW